MSTDNTRDPREQKAGHFKWLDRNTYKNMGNLQADLSETEREMLIGQLAVALDRYERLALGLSNVRRALFYAYSQAVETGFVTSRFSRRFNMSKKGHNKQIANEIDRVFKRAWSHEESGDGEGSADELRIAGLSHKVLFDPKVTAFVEAESLEATQELIRVKQFQATLFLSTVKMAVGIARKHNATLDGSMIEWTDLSQEAVIGSMAAVEAYHPVDSGKTFTSFVHNWVKGIVRKKVTETTRTVQVPRSTVDRYGFVQKAIKDLEIVLTDIRGGMRFDHMMADGKINADTLNRIVDQANTYLSDANLIKRPFSPEEVHSLIMSTQDEISLDLEVEGADGTETTTLGEMMPDDAPDVEQQIDGALVGRRLMRIVKRFTDEQEYAIMELRYGGRDHPGCGKVTDQYILETGKPMNKTKVRKIEKRVFERLKRAVAADPQLRQQFMEIAETLPLIPEHF
jgi:DNA-directed RNA polymerase sigma subunit (sigma70/sigma32)